jgi:hypothetical protein
MFKVCWDTTVPTWMIYTIYTFFLKHKEDLKQIKIKLDTLLQFNEISTLKRCHEIDTKKKKKINKDEKYCK